MNEVNVAEMVMSLEYVNELLSFALLIILVVVSINGFKIFRAESRIWKELKELEKEKLKKELESVDVRSSEAGNVPLGELRQPKCSIPALPKSKEKRRY